MNAMEKSGGAIHKKGLNERINQGAAIIKEGVWICFIYWNDRWVSHTVVQYKLMLPPSVHQSRLVCTMGIQDKNASSTELRILFYYIFKRKRRETILMLDNLLYK